MYDLTFRAHPDEHLADQVFLMEKILPDESYVIFITDL